MTAPFAQRIALPCAVLVASCLFALRASAITATTTVPVTAGHHHHHAKAPAHHAAAAPAILAARPKRRQPAPTHKPAHLPSHVAKPPLPKAPAPPPALLPPAAPPDPAKGAATGLPIPRFAALRADQVNLRAGPGTRYPIDWIYQRRDLPVKITREFEVWRLVEQQDGTKGWVHAATLTGRRAVLITGDQPQTLRATAVAAGDPVAILKPGVVGRLLSCAAAADWCQVQIKSFRGFLPRSAFWGTLPGESVGP